MNPSEHVRIVDVGPRDGLQNEPQPVPTAIKVELVQRLARAGVQHIEVTSFVSPKWVAQMADHAEVLSAVATRQPRADVCHSVLVPNMRGMQALLGLPRACWPQEIVVFGSASEAFSQKNINCSIGESMARFAPVVQAALENGIHVRGAMSCTVGCPYEGEVPPRSVGALAAHMRRIGVQHVTVADTTGVGSPRQVRRALEATLAHYDVQDVSGHFHDTWGQALANTLAALDMGVRRFDTSVAGLGGCPYAKGASGNVASEDVVYMLHGMGLHTGIDLAALVQAGQFISSHLGRQTHSRAARAWLAAQASQGMETNA